MNSLIEKKYNTPLGTVLCSLYSDAKIIELESLGTYKNGVFERYNSKSHHIEVVEFKLKMPLYNSETVADSTGWIWRIQKVNENPEKLSL